MGPQVYLGQIQIAIASLKIASTFVKSKENYGFQGQTGPIQFGKEKYQTRESTSHQPTYLLYRSSQCNLFVWLMRQGSVDILLQHLAMNYDDGVNDNHGDAEENDDDDDYV